MNRAEEKLISLSTVEGKTEALKGPCLRAESASALLQRFSSSSTVPSRPAEPGHEHHSGLLVCEPMTLKTTAGMHRFTIATIDLAAVDAKLKAAGLAEVRK